MAALQTLPLELLLQIIEYLPPLAAVDFALAHYPLLLSHRLVPALSIQTVQRLRLRRRAVSNLPTIPGLSSDTTWYTMRYLSLEDRIWFVMAMYLR